MKCFSRIDYKKTMISSRSSGMVGMLLGQHLNFGESKIKDLHIGFTLMIQRNNVNAQSQELDQGAFQRNSLGSPQKSWKRSEE